MLVAGVLFLGERLRMQHVIGFGWGMLGLGLLFATHDLSLLPGTVEQVVVLADGAVVERGATAEVLAAPQHAVTRALRAAVPRPIG